jgi:hypothetical protein
MTCAHNCVRGSTIASANDVFANTTRRAPSSKPKGNNRPIPDEVSMAKRPSMPKADPKTAATLHRGQQFENGSGVANVLAGDKISI